MLKIKVYFNFYAFFFYNIKGPMADTDEYKNLII